MAGLPEAAAKTVQETVAEYEAQATLEARCARDADKLECLIYYGTDLVDYIH